MAIVGIRTATVDHVTRLRLDVGNLYVDDWGEVCRRLPGKTKKSEVMDSPLGGGSKDLKSGGKSRVASTDVQTFREQTAGRGKMKRTRVMRRGSGSLSTSSLKLETPNGQQYQGGSRMGRWFSVRKRSTSVTDDLITRAVHSSPTLIGLMGAAAATTAGEGRKPYHVMASLPDGSKHVVSIIPGNA